MSGMAGNKVWPDLRPCPVCGNTYLWKRTELYRDDSGIHRGYMVSCEVSCITQRSPSRTPEEAAKQWNKRYDHKA